MNTARGVSSDGLMAALADASLSVERLAAALESSARDVGDGAVDVRADVTRTLGVLSRQVDIAVTQLLRRKEHRDWEGRFGALSWPERSHDMAQLLTHDPEAGTLEWFRAWLSAVTVGAFEEAWRLLRLPADLAGWAAWLPDRAAVLIMAIQNAQHDARMSSDQLDNFVEFLLQPARSPDDPSAGALDRLAHGFSPARISLVLLVARILALAGDGRARELVERARHLYKSANTEDVSSLSAIVAAESFVARHNLAVGERREHIARTKNADLAGIHEFVETRRSGRLAAVPNIDASLLPTVQSLVDGLPTVAGAVEKLGLLLEPASPELILAVSTRLLAEGQVESAEFLCEPLWVPDLAETLRAPAIALRKSIAESLDVDDDARAAALSAVGDQAMWSGVSALGLECFEAAHELAPRDASILRRLADAVYVSSAGLDPDDERPVVERALDYCRQADALAPVTPDVVWVHNLRRFIHQRLRMLSTPHDSEHLWLALREACAGFAARASEGPDRWHNVGFDLREVGLLRTSYFLSTQFDDPAGSDDSRWDLFYSAVNLGRGEEALALLPEDAEEGERPAWVDAVRGYTYGVLEDRRFVDALGRAVETGDVEYTQWLAEFLTEAGSRDALAHWQRIAEKADIEIVSQAEAAACAALLLGDDERVRMLHERQARDESFKIGWSMTSWAAAVAGIVNGADEGWDALEARFANSIVLREVDHVRRLTRTAFEWRGLQDAASLSSRVDRIAQARSDEIRALFPDADAHAEMLAELDWAVAHFCHETVTATIETLRTQVLDRLGVSEDVAADYESEPETPSTFPIQAYVPPSWFDEWAGRETEHELFVRGLPLARAAFARRPDTDVAVRDVNIGVDVSCEPSRVDVSPSSYAIPGDEISFNEVDDWKGWYCNENWLGGLSEERRLAAVPVGQGGLYRVPEPRDVAEQLSSWTGTETIARGILRAAEMAAMNERESAGTQPDGGATAEPGSAG